MDHYVLTDWNFNDLLPLFEMKTTEYFENDENSQWILFVAIID